MTAEQRVLAAIEAAGGAEVRPDLHAIAAPAGGATVFVVIERTKKGALTGIALVVPLAPRGASSDGGATSVDWLPAVAFAPEDAGHRAAKARRVATELQSGDPSFDASVWVESDARAREVAPLLALAPLRQAVCAVLSGGAGLIELHNGKDAHLRVEPAGPIDAEALARLAAHARVLHAALPAFRSTAWRLRLGPGGLLVRLSAGLALVGLGAALVATDLWETLTDALVWQAALASAPLYALFAILARWRARRSHEGVFRFWFAAITGLVWIPGATVAAAYAANAVLDTTLAIRTVHLVSKHEARGKNTHLTARIAPWPPLTDPIVMSPPRATFDRLPASGPIRARVGDGWLGHAWIEDLEPVD